MWIRRSQQKSQPALGQRVGLDYDFTSSYSFSLFLKLLRSANPFSHGAACVSVQRGRGPSPSWQGHTPWTPRWTTVAPPPSSARCAATSSPSSSGWRGWSMARRASTTPPSMLGDRSSSCCPRGRSGPAQMAPTWTNWWLLEPRRRMQGCTFASGQTPWATASGVLFSQSCQVSWDGFLPLLSVLCIMAFINSTTAAHWFPGHLWCCADLG